MKVSRKIEKASVKAFNKETNNTIIVEVEKNGCRTWKSAFEKVNNTDVFIDVVEVNTVSKVYDIPNEVLENYEVKEVY